MITHYVEKRTRKNGSSHYVIMKWALGCYCNWIDKKFDSFIDAVLFQRRRELNKIAKTKAIFGRIDHA